MGDGQRRPEQPAVLFLQEVETPAAESHAPWIAEVDEHVEQVIDAGACLATRRNVRTHAVLADG